MRKNTAQKSVTESVDPAFDRVDTMSAKESLTALWKRQVASLVAIGPAIEMMVPAVNKAADVLAANENGRIIYVGAGTPERIEIQDGAELLPTFGWPTERVIFMGAAGARGLRKAMEGAEDNIPNAIKRINKLKLSPSDVVVCIASSGTTPYVLAACKLARDAGATTIAISSNPYGPLLQAAEFPIFVDTGAEPISGSTRMNAGTAQTSMLKMWSTAVMIRMGRTLGPYMVCMIPLNDKLRLRARDMVVKVLDRFNVVCTPARAARALEHAKDILGPRETDKNIRLAMVTACGKSVGEAHELLGQNHYNLRQTMESMGLKDKINAPGFRPN